MSIRQVANKRVSVCFSAHKWQWSCSLIPNLCKVALVGKIWCRILNWNIESCAFSNPERHLVSLINLLLISIGFSQSFFWWWQGRISLQQNIKSSKFTRELVDLFAGGCNLPFKILIQLGGVAGHKP